MGDEFPRRLWPPTPCDIILSCKPAGGRGSQSLRGNLSLKANNVIRRINHYPADSMACFVNTYPLDSDLSVIQPSNNWSQGGERHCEGKVSYPREQHNVTGQGSNPDCSIWRSAQCLCCKRFRGVGVQRKTKELDFRRFAFSALAPYFAQAKHQKSHSLPTTRKRLLHRLESTLSSKVFTI